MDADICCFVRRMGFLTCPPPPPMSTHPTGFSRSPDMSVEFLDEIGCGYSTNFLGGSRPYEVQACLLPAGSGKLIITGNLSQVGSGLAHRAQ